jgi:uncharacterized protein (DUF4415 family)
MKKKTDSGQRKEVLRRIASLKEEEIDTSDIPELTEEQMRSGVRGMLYRPVKRPVTIRLDADVVEWLKKDGSGYQTKANRLLRFEMLKSYAEKKRARAVGGHGRKKTKKSGTS